jgi:7-keto-8-aminopelargonate synthetase-like enzyme
MDGDVAPLPALREAADALGARLVVDEAHATGVLGATGRGIAEHFGGSIPVEVSIGTLGKALGALGGFVTGSAALCEWIGTRARTLFYTTAAPPAICAAALEALRILEAEPQRVDSLRRKAERMRRRLAEGGLEVPGGVTPVIPIVTGSASRAETASQALLDRGWFVTGIRPPTVAEGTSRLRVSVNEPHADEEIDAFARAAAEVLQAA